MHFFTVFPGAWLAGTADLTAEETGAFWSLCCHYMAKDGVVPDDNATLGRITKLGTRRWQRVRHRLIEGVHIEIRDGHIRQETCDKRLKFDGRFARSQRAKAEKRWAVKNAKRLNGNNSVDTGADAGGYPDTGRGVATAFR